MVVTVVVVQHNCNLSPEQAGMKVAGRGYSQQTVSGADDESVEQRHVETQRRQSVEQERGVTQTPDSLGGRARRAPGDRQHCHGGEHQRDADQEQGDGRQPGGRRQPRVQDHHGDRRGRSQRHVRDAVDRRSKREREVDDRQRDEQHDQQRAQAAHVAQPRPVRVDAVQALDGRAPKVVTVKQSSPDAATGSRVVTVVERRRIRRRHSSTSRRRRRRRVGIRSRRQRMNRHSTGSGTHLNRKQTDAV